jgi:WD40 repeat protein
MAERSCPGPARLGQHLDGVLAPEVEAAVVAHLDTCAQCQRTLEELAGGGEPLLAVARQVGAAPPVSTPALRAVLHGLAHDTEVPDEPEAGPDGGVLALLAPPERPGEIGRLGPYAVLGVIGRGGMGVVLKAHDESLRRPVAIKVLAPQLAAAPAARERFLREARAAAAVRNEHVVAIHAVEEAYGLPFLVMEYLPGETLQERIERGGPLGPEEVVRIGRAAAEGLAAAHARGLVHRDVKPSNILLEAGRAKITDFGLARAAGDATLTYSGHVVGTPRYMSPEQADCGPVDGRADLFSLGCVLYAVCTGQAPFDGEGPLAVLRQVCEREPTPVREVNPAMPGWLAAVIARLMAKHSAERFQSAAEVAEVLAKRQAPPARRTNPRRGRRWAAAAALLLAGGLALTEATGATQFAATLVRIASPDGVLVVRVDDPAVKVTVEREGEVVITGAGPQEVRLRPGQYRLKAARDGQVLRTELVTITRGDRRVVSVHLEPPEPPPGEIRRLEGHLGFVHAVDVSGDGRRAISGSWDRTVRVWDLATRRELRCFSRHHGLQAGIYCVALSPDGRLALAGGSDGKVWLWNVETGEERGRCQVPTDGTTGATALAFSADGRRALVGGFGRRVGLWQVSLWKELKQLDCGHGVWSVCFSPDGRRVLTATGDGRKGIIRLWDLETGAEGRRFEGQEEGTWRAVFSPDGRHVLSAGLDATLRLWDARTGKEVRCFRGHIRPVTGAAFSPDGRRAVSASADQTIRLWDVATGAELHRFLDRDGHIQTVAYVPGGRQALSGSRRGTIHLWQLPP